MNENATTDEGLKARLEELADKAGVDLSAPPAHTAQTSAQRPAQARSAVSGGATETFGGWPLVHGIIDPRAFCRPPRGSNLALLPMHGGRAAVTGGMAWEVWCVSVCGCEAHVARRETMAGQRRTMIRDEEEVTG